MIQILLINTILLITAILVIIIGYIIHIFRKASKHGLRGNFDPFGCGACIIMLIIVISIISLSAMGSG